MAVVLWLFTGMEFGLNFIRNVLIAGHFGASYKTDAYFGVYGLLLAFGLFANGLIQTAFLPVFARVKEQQGEQPARQLFWATAAALALTCVSLIGLWLLCSPVIIRLLFAGYTPQAKALVQSFFWQLAPAGVMAGIIPLISGVLYYHRHRLAPSFASLVSSLIILLSFIFLVRRFEINSLIIGVLIGTLFSVGIQYGAMRRYTASPCASRSCLQQHLPRMWGIAWPLLCSMGLIQVVSFWEYFLTSQMFGGALSVLNYAKGISELPARFVSVSAGAIAFPALVRCISAKRYPDFASAFLRYSRCVFLVLVPVSLFVAVAALPLVELIFARGNFSHTDALRVAAVLRIYVVGLVGVGMGFLLNYSFAALGATVQLAKASSLIVPLVLIFDLVAVRWWSYQGLAAGYVLLIYGMTLLLWSWLSKIAGGERMTLPMSFLVKILIAGLLAAGLVYAGLRLGLGPGASWLQRGEVCCATLTAAGLFYLFLLRRFNIQELPRCRRLA